MYESRSADQRRYPRAQLAHPVRFQHHGEQREGTLRELSEGGALLETAEPLEGGAWVRLHLALDLWRGSPDGCELDGRVLRTEGPDSALIFADRLLPRNRLLLRDFVWRSRRDAIID